MFFASSVANELTRSMRRTKAKWVPGGGNRFFYNTCPLTQTSSSARRWKVPTTRTFMSSALNVLDEIPCIRVHCIWIDPRSLRSIMYELRLLAVRCFPALISPISYTNKGQFWYFQSTVATIAVTTPNYFIIVNIEHF